MKKIILLLIIVVILSSFTLVCSAEDRVDGYINDFGELLPNEFSEKYEAGTLADAAELGGLFSLIIAAISDGRANILGFFLSLVGVSALCAAASLVGGSLAERAQIAVGIICSVTVFLQVRPLVSAVEEGIGRISGFFSSLIPIAAGLTALGGGEATSLVQATGMYTAFSLVGGAMGRIFLTLTSFGLAGGLLTAFGGEGIGSVLRGVRGLFGWLTGIFTALITASFSLQTLFAASADSAAMRAIKYAASGLIPVVGSTVSAAISTLASGVSYAKGVIGGGAILVILYMAISPLVLILAYRLMLSLAMILADLVGGSMASGIFSAYRQALDMTVTAYALSALIYLFEIVIITMMGVSLS